MEINVYRAIQLMQQATEPFTVVFTSVNQTKNEGGEREVLERVKIGPKRHNINERLMVGLQIDDKTIRHIYIHSIMELHLHDGSSYKTKMQ